VVLVAEGHTHSPRRRVGLRTRFARLAASPGFQRWAAGVPLVRRIAKAEGQELFDIVQGFVASQVLFAIVELRILHRVMDGPLSADQLAQGTGIAPERMTRLVQAGAALGLLRRTGNAFSITRKGAALTGVPGLEQMIRHHDVLYRDLADPVAFLRSETETELAGFWPYVFGASGAVDPKVTSVYSDLMAQSQGLVAQDTLRSVSLHGLAKMADIGGGSGAFAEAAAAAAPSLEVTLYDLPKVIDAAGRRLEGSPHRGRIVLAPGSFRDDPLPSGMDAMSLIRVLYDHEDTTVRALLAKVFKSLPPGGRVIVSEPMSGGVIPDRAGDVYFAFYCMAMRTGTVRSQARIAELLKEAGFGSVRTPRSSRPFVTSVVEASVPVTS
jgi:demethylspheroidene O-methyltransferase